MIVYRIICLMVVVIVVSIAAREVLSVLGPLVPGLIILGAVVLLARGLISYSRRF